MVDSLPVDEFTSDSVDTGNR